MSMWGEPGMPCRLCQVNAWTDCRHRKAKQAPPPEFNPPEDRRITEDPLRRGISPWGGWPRGRPRT